MSMVVLATNKIYTWVSSRLSNLGRSFQGQIFVRPIEQDFYFEGGKTETLCRNPTWPGHQCGSAGGSCGRPQICSAVWELSILSFCICDSGSYRNAHHCLFTSPVWYRKRTGNPYITNSHCLLLSASRRAT